jgi:hypothetical protein
VLQSPSYESKCFASRHSVEQSANMAIQDRILSSVGGKN